MNSVLEVVLRPVKKIYALYDQFSQALPAGSVNGSLATPPQDVDLIGVPQVRTVVDTENKLSVANGALTFAGGKTSPSYGDPGIWWPAIARAAGRAAIFSLNITSGSNMMIGLAVAASGTTMNECGMRFTGGTTLNIRDNLGFSNVGIYANANTYKVAFVLRAAGFFFLIKGGAYTNWTLLIRAGSGNTATLYPGIHDYDCAMTADDIIIPNTLYTIPALASDSFTRANGAIGSTDGLATAEGGGAGIAWSGSAATISSNKAVITPTLGVEQASGTLTVGTWYSITATETNHFYTGSAIGDTFLAAATTALDANNKVKALSNIGASVLTNTPNVIVRGKVSACTTATQAGLRVRLDSETTPATFIVCTFNGTQVIVRECVAGTYATLGTYTKSFTADDTVIVDANSTTLRIYHVTAAGIESLLSSSPPTTNVTTGNNHGIFSTLAANKFSSFECHAKGAEGQYAGLDTL